MTSTSSRADRPCTSPSRWPAGAVYLLAILLFGRILGSGSGPVSILAAGLLALAIQPVMIRVRRRLSRVIFGARDDPSEVLTRLSDRLESTAAAGAILPSIVETLGTTLRLAHAAIEIILPDGTVERVVYGEGRPGEVEVPLQHQGEEIGRLLLSAGRGRELFGPADRPLIDTLVSQLSVTANNVLLHRQLQRSLERVVSAREEERRRLRRDIHDGLGPTLAAGTMRLEVARSLLSGRFR